MKRSLVAVLLVLGSLSMAAPAQAAPECRGVIQCWQDRVRECITNLALPPRPC